MVIFNSYVKLPEGVYIYIYPYPTEVSSTWHITQSQLEAEENRIWPGRPARAIRKEIWEEKIRRVGTW